MQSMYLTFSFAFDHGLLGISLGRAGSYKYLRTWNNHPSVRLSQRVEAVVLVGAEENGTNVRDESCPVPHSVREELSFLSAGCEGGEKNSQCGWICPPFIQSVHGESCSSVLFILRLMMDLQNK